jgi:hypothetical protein
MGSVEEHEIQIGFTVHLIVWRSRFSRPPWRACGEEIEYSMGGKPPVGIRRLEEGSLVPDWAGEEAREGKRRHRSRVIFPRDRGELDFFLVSDI